MRETLFCALFPLKACDHERPRIFRGGIIRLVVIEVKTETLSRLCMMVQNQLHVRAGYCNDDISPTPKHMNSETEKLQSCEQYTLLKSQFESLKGRYLSDSNIFQKRLDEQSQVLEDTASECSRLKIVYDHDMDELKCLTEILKNRITSLQATLQQKEQRMQLLLRSELLEILCFTVTGSRIASRSEIVTAFWNEKPDTRMQLLDWFSELQPNDTRRIHDLEQKLATPHVAHRR
jgi:hypothetical protein